MYVPAHFAAGDLSEIAAFVEQAGAADLVTFDGTGLAASLLPVIWDPAGGGHGRLLPSRQRMIGWRHRSDAERVTGGSSKPATADR